MVQGYFQKIIADKQESGLINDEQAKVLFLVLQAMDDEQRKQLSDIITANADLADVLFDNILRKFEALGVDDLDGWNRVIAYELEKLDALSDSHAKP
jgi:hypothetical protein